MRARKAKKKTEIAYQVFRSDRSTADIIIERDGGVIVRAPEWAHDGLIAEIIRSKEYWIYQALAEWRDLNATRVLREYKNGEGFLYLGRAYRLALVSDQKEPLQLRNGRFSLRRDLADNGQIAAARTAFRAFYTSRGMDRLGERVAYYAPKVGVRIKDLEVRDLRHRWASCTPSGRLSFHWKCMMAPLNVIDYIVVHELCHLRRRDHDEAFWNEIDKVMPDFAERKDWLRKHGAGLVV